MDNKIQSIDGIILAAGNSSRLGTPKQLLKIGDEEVLIRKIILSSLKSKLKRTWVILGGNVEEIQSDISDLKVEIVLNPLWQSGMASSLLKGLSSVLENDSEIDAVLVLLCDQPFVEVDLINQLIEKYQQTKASMIVCDYGDGQLGVPGLFDKSIFSEIFKLSGDVGARKIIQQFAHQCMTIPFEKGKWDIDTEEDIRKIQEIMVKKKS